MILKFTVEGSNQVALISEVASYDTGEDGVFTMERENGEVYVMASHGPVVTMNSLGDVLDVYYPEDIHDTDEENIDDDDGGINIIVVTGMENPQSPWGQFVE